MKTGMYMLANGLLVDIGLNCYGQVLIYFDPTCSTLFLTRYEFNKLFNDIEYIGVI